MFKGLEHPSSPSILSDDQKWNKQTNKNMLYFEKFQLVLALGVLMLSVGVEVTNEPLPEGDDRLEFMKIQ